MVVLPTAAAREADRVFEVAFAPELLDEEKLLDAAISSLEEYDLVGVFSDSQGFVDAYCQDLALPRQALPVLNVTRGRKQAGDVPASLIQHVRASNRVDLALYDWAQRRFLRQRDNIARSVHGSGRRNEITRRIRHCDQEKDSAVNFGSRQIELMTAHCLGQQSGSATIRAGETATVHLSCHAFAAEDDLTIGIGVRDGNGTTVCSSNTKILGIAVAVQANKSLQLAISFDAWLPAGEYQVTLALHKGITHLDGCYHWVENATRFTVTGEAQAPAATSADSTLKIARIA